MPNDESTDLYVLLGGKDPAEELGEDKIVRHSPLDRSEPAQFPDVAPLARNTYGVRWYPTWPHISLGISAHIGRQLKFWHLSLHLPVGVVIIGHTGTTRS